MSDARGGFLSLIDAHVHIYNCFDLGDVLDSAFENFNAEACNFGMQEYFNGLLLLTEASKYNYFDRMYSYASTGEAIEGASSNAWRFYHTDETCSLVARNGCGRQLTLIAGRQIVSKENLEVLALATRTTFHDGAPIRSLIKAISDSGGIVVLPWGVGKWVGKRGKIVQSMLSSSNGPTFFLGDNGGRPIFWPRPAMFRIAALKGVRVLPGTDPLPLQSEGSRCGSFGFATRGLVSREHPQADIKRLLEERSAEIVPYGSLERPLRFVRNQIRLRLRQR